MAMTEAASLPSRLSWDPDLGLALMLGGVRLGRLASCDDKTIPSHRLPPTMSSVLVEEGRAAVLHHSVGSHPTIY